MGVEAGGRQIRQPRAVGAPGVPAIRKAGAPELDSARDHARRLSLVPLVRVAAVSPGPSCCGVAGSAATGAPQKQILWIKLLTPLGSE